MKDFMITYLGYILILVGVLCLVIYYLGVQTNILLLLALVLEVAGILSFIFLHKKGIEK